MIQNDFDKLYKHPDQEQSAQKFSESQQYLKHKIMCVWPFALQQVPVAVRAEHFEKRKPPQVFPQNRPYLVLPRCIHGEYVAARNIIERT